MPLSEPPRPTRSASRSPRKKPAAWPGCATWTEGQRARWGKLFRAQSDEGIDAGGAPGGKVGRADAREGHRDGSAEIDDEVERGHGVEEIGEAATGCEREERAGDQASEGDAQAGA